MQTSDFYYDLPPELIAQTPAQPRDASRMLCLNRATGAMAHRHFYDLPGQLRAGDLLVLNNTKVLPARLIGRRAATGGMCELLLLREAEKDLWECLARPAKRLKTGSTLRFGDGSLTGTVVESLAEGLKRVRFEHDTQTLQEKLDVFGKMPLPPYITQELADATRYQTVYAKHTGSAAAPTAGLHFTPGLMRALADKGVRLAEITLHVGLGTFRPVQTQTVENHHMHTEWYSIGKQAADLYNETRDNGGRVIAVGTTSCRTLETVCAQNNGRLRSGSGDTGIFIYPGYRFCAIDGLVTNFHLPESTLLMLVAAFCGLVNTLAAYQKAVEMRYRFFSFGDSMLII